MDRSTIISGVTITHPERVLYPAMGYTKKDILSYYETIVPRMLPYLLNRPVSLVRTPAGVDNIRFFQKHPQESFPDYIERVQIQEKEKVGIYITLDALNDILYLVNIGVLEFHTWQSSLPDIEEPNQLVFDFDPAPDAPWENVVLGAHLLHDILDSYGLTSFIKTSGIKGFHVLVPFATGPSWQTAKDFSRGIAEKMIEEHPDMFTLEMKKEDRSGKVFIDYLRNTRGATNVAPYSTRTYPTATVSVPIPWELVTIDMKPTRFTIKDASSLFHEDPWDSFFTVKQKLPKPGG